MDKSIQKHFEELGGLEVSVDIDYNESLELLLANIERYLGRKVDADALEVLKEYQGFMFLSDDPIGIIVSNDIPILGGAEFLDFGVFLTIHKSSYQVEAILTSNEDLFGKKFLPFAEATPGDYFALSLEDNSIYFISHDYNENEKSHFKLSKSIKSFCMSLKKENQKSEEKKVKPKIVKVTYDADFFKQAKEEAEKMKSKKNK